MSNNGEIHAPSKAEFSLRAAIKVYREILAEEGQKGAKRYLAWVIRNFECIGDGLHARRSS